MPVSLLMDTVPAGPCCSEYKTRGTGLETEKWIVFNYSLDLFSVFPPIG